MREHADAASQRHEALAYRLAFHAAELVDTDRAAARMLAIAAFEIHPAEEIRAQLIDTLVWGENVRLRTASAWQTALSADGRAALIGDGAAAGVWDLTSRLDPKTGEVTEAFATLKGGRNGQTAVELTPDGRAAISGGDEGATIWDLGDPAKPIGSATLPSQDGASVEAVALSADGRRAVIADFHGELAVWDLSDGARPKRRSTTRAHNSYAVDLDLSSDGRVAVTSADDGTVRSWYLTDPANPVKTADLSDPTNTPTAVAVSADGRTVLVGAAAQLEVWRLEGSSPPRRVTRFEGPLAGISSVSLSSDGGTALVTGESSSGLLWNLSNPSAPVLLARLKGDDHDIDSSALSADGGVALTAGAGGSTMWDLRSLAEIVADPEAVACDGRLGAEISRADWIRFTGQADWSDYGRADWDGLPVCRIRNT
ncbi:hypothetical protein GT755_27095 [Herbidospora sp. NEAU-GS84]|uniref:Uncharacterized protein n=1 Tax=Herbidospora solisilvae TaxID=2696284 RepID=A0A7C9NKB9_9ACTN|nr:hypothetical protein [Herbidospora solisilvae]NAS25338.1 hypothetical protein [Herbidospora solisilvae]